MHGAETCASMSPSRTRLLEALQEPAGYLVLIWHSRHVAQPLRVSSQTPRRLCHGMHHKGRQWTLPPNSDQTSEQKLNQTKTTKAGASVVHARC